MAVISNNSHISVPYVVPTTDSAAQDLWDFAKMRLRANLTDLELTSLNMDAFMLQDLKDGVMSISAPSAFLKQWLGLRADTVLGYCQRPDSVDVLRVDVVLRSAMRSAAKFDPERQFLRVDDWIKADVPPQLVHSGKRSAPKPDFEPLARDHKLPEDLRLQAIIEIICLRFHVSYTTASFLRETKKPLMAQKLAMYLGMRFCPEMSREELALQLGGYTLPAMIACGDDVEMLNRNGRGRVRADLEFLLQVYPEQYERLLEAA